MSTPKFTKIELFKPDWGGGSSIILCYAFITHPTYNLVAISWTLTSVFYLGYTIFVPEVYEGFLLYIFVWRGDHIPILGHCEVWCRTGALSSSLLLETEISKNGIKQTQ